MLVKVLKAFAYAPDCRTHLLLAPGDVVEVVDDVIPGLEAEGFAVDASDAEIEAAQQGPVVMLAPVDIPATWRTLTGVALKALAAALNGGPVKDAKAATAIIAAEVARRAD